MLRTVFYRERDSVRKRGIEIGIICVMELTEVSGMFVYD